VGGRRALGVVAAAAVLVLGVGTTAALTLDRAPDDGATGTAAVAPSPTGVPTRPALLPAPAASAPVPSTAALQALVDAALAQPAVAGRLSVSVVDVATERVLYERAADAPVLPASTTKIATAAAALIALPADRRLVTSVVAGPAPGEVVLVGGGDTTLSGVPEVVPPVPAAGPDVGPDRTVATAYPPPARLTDLAAEVQVSLAGAPVTRVVVDDSLYVPEPLAPGWKESYVTQGAVAPVTPLMLDGGRVTPGRSRRHTDPALAAGRELAALLAPGASVVVERGLAPPGAARLGAVESPTVPELVERMLVRSDNDLAESLAHAVAIERGQPASFAGGSAAMAQVLAAKGVDTSGLADGSGLSRLDRLAPSAVTSLLVQAASGEDPRLAPLLDGLPVSGFVGTLADRYRAGEPGAPAAGAVRAKTGTLNDVSALAGLVRTADGRLLAFDVTADGVPLGATQGAEDALDALAAAIAACGCP
jgi:D-alanyl-D-alanine carboxypeptidase/D-alanyl-D-alanine-endopeptidase (penicillin-binding protein 4)